MTRSLAKLFLHAIIILGSLTLYSQSKDYDILKARVKVIDSLPQSGIIEGRINTTNGLGEGGYSDYWTVLNHKILKVSAGQTIHYGYGKIDTPNTELIKTEFYYNNDSVFFIRQRIDYYDMTKYYCGETTELFIPNNAIRNIYIGEKSQKSHYESLLSESVKHFNSCKEFLEEQDNLSK